MVTVTIQPYENSDLQQITTRYPDATITPGPTKRYSQVSIPSKNANNWNQEDADFFTNLVERDVLSNWGIVGGRRSMQ